MLLRISDTKQPTVSAKLKQVACFQKLQIANPNKKLDTILSQVNAPEI